MNNPSTEYIDSEIIGFDISDEALEAAGLVTISGAAYTQFAYCTQFSCPDGEDAWISRLDVLNVTASATNVCSA